MAVLNDPNNPQDPNAQKNPIEPGQFVVTGDQNDIFKEPQNPASTTPEPPPQNLKQDTPPASNLPGVEPPLAPPPTPMFEPPSPASSQENLAGVQPQEPQFENQPSPTPYVPPTTEGQTPQSPQSIISRLRVVFIAVGFLLLVALIGAGVYFFILGKSKKSDNTTQTTQESAELPLPTPARTSGGFSELPPATPSAQESTPSGD